MKREVFINMENEIFRGNILDIGMDNCGIIYSIYKEFNDDVSVEYLYGKKEKEKIQKDFYHTCILFFSLSKLWLNTKRNDFIKDIYGYLKQDGLLYIWDIDKGVRKIFNGDIKVAIPGKKVRKIKISDFNILKDNSKDRVLKLLEGQFDILDFKHSDGIFYIKAKKKQSKDNIIEVKEIEKKDECAVSSS